MLGDLIRLIYDVFEQIYDLFPMYGSISFLNLFIYPFSFCVFCAILFLPLGLIFRVINKLR